MKAFHVNIGQVFAQPYESNYARLRHILIANPGIPFLVLAKYLRERFPERRNILDRARALYKSSTVTADAHDEWRGYRRQCPHCAEQLYHTDIYALEWLTRCPIHLCDFMTKCPHCGQPWPKPDEIQQRLCPGCGIPTPQQLERAMQLRQGAVFDAIGELYALITTCNTPPGVVLVSDAFMSGKHDDWELAVPLHDVRFPAFQARRLPDFPNAKLRALGLSTYRVAWRTAQLLPVTPNDDALLDSYLRSHQHGVIRTIDPQRTGYRLVALWGVLRQVTNWIRRQTSIDHPLQITSYRWMEMYELVDGPDICPYCLAFSLWLFHSFAACNRREMAAAIDAYPFCVLGGLDYFLTASEPFVLVNFQRRFKTDAAFTSWYYRRGLLISFVDVLRFAFDLQRQLRHYRRNLEDRRLSRFKDRVFSDRYDHVELCNEQLIYYYENENPLDGIAPPRDAHSDVICRKYQQYYSASTRGKRKKFFEPIAATELTGKDFLELKNSFSEFAHEVYPED